MGESKQLLSGKHLIAPLTCRGCSTEVGWKYFVSPDSTQRYKEGKCILEKGKIYKARTATFSVSLVPMGLTRCASPAGQQVVRRQRWRRGRAVAGATPEVET